MRKRALLVHPSGHSDIAENIKGWLNEVCAKNGDNFSLEAEKYQQDAERCIEEVNYDFLVSHLNISYNKDTSMQAQQRGRNGLNLLKNFRRSKLDVPALIISPMADSMSYHDLKHFEPADIIIDGIDLERNFKDAIERLFSHTEKVQRQVSEKIASVDIGILFGMRGSYYRIVGEGFAYQNEGALVFTRSMVEKLGEMSDIIAEESRDRDPKWKEDFATLGNMIREQLFSGKKNNDFLKGYEKVMGLINNEVRNFRFRFIVEQETHNIIFEALMGDDGEFIMLHSPMYRRLAVPSTRYALFHNPDPDDKNRKLNCLVIRADVSGDVEELSVRLEPISNVEQEVQFWDITLRKDPSLDITVIDSAENGKSYFETVMYYLTKENQDWDIVHFAGHSAYIRKDENKKEGYLFFPGENEGEIKPVALELFAHLLYDANVKLVYLSSCHSPEKGFVFEMVQRNVPAAIGFRWDIEDEMAEKFTRKFYTYLLEKKSLEMAFLETRKNLYITEHDNPIWAAAMLVIQI